MAVSEQTPYIEYVANGVSTNYPLEFDCDKKEYLIVLVDDVEPVVGAWSFSNGAVVFNTAPENGKKITIQRNTPFSRTTDYQSYNNSFRPPSINNDFDRVWYKIQELGVRDWLLDLKIQKFRDDVNLTALENTLEEAKQIRDDTADSVVEVQSNVAQSQSLLIDTTNQANLAQGYASSANSANAAAQQAVIDVSTAEANVYSALSAQQIVVNNSLTAIAGGHKAYQTLALAQAAQATFPVNSIVEVTNDPTSSNNGTYQWNGTTLTKSVYDPLTQAKDYTDEKSLEVSKTESLKATSDIVKTNSVDLHYFVDSSGNIVASIDDNGVLTAQGIKTPDGSIKELAEKTNSLTLDTSSTTHQLVDSQGNILFELSSTGIPKASFSFFSSAEMRTSALSQADKNKTGLTLDLMSIANDSPKDFDVTVAAHGADGALHQRMATGVKVSENRLFVAFTQFSTTATDSANGRLVGRFVDFDFNTQTATVGNTQQILGNFFGNIWRHPNFIKLKDRILLILNGAMNELFVYETFDNCQTFALKTQIASADPLPWALALDSAVRIEEGLYAGRIVLSLFRYYANTNTGDIGTVYSDDGGATWVRGATYKGVDYFPAYPSINEISVAPDADNNLIFVIRNEHTVADARHLIFAKSTDGGATLQFFNQDTQTAATLTQTGLKQISPNSFSGIPKIISTCPSDKNNRKAMRLRVSYDGCKSWANEYSVFNDQDTAGYSSLVPIDAKNYAIIYEDGSLNVNQSIKIKFLNLKRVFN